MHVAFIVSQFPSLSHTFIDSQILGLQSAGHRVSVHAFTPPVTPLVHAYWLTPNHPLEIHQGQRSPQGFWSRLRLAFRLAPQFRQAKCLWLLGLLAPPFHPFARRLEPLVWAAPLLGALDADVWVCHFGDVALRAQAVMHLARQRVPLLAFFHGADISRFVQRHGEGVYRQLLEEIEGCCAISVRWLNRLLDLGARPDRVHLHHMGVDCVHFSVQTRTLSSEGPVRLLSVARLVEKKGVEYGIRAITLLPPSLRDRIDYRIVGSGPLRKELQDLIDQEGLGAQVRLSGEKNEADVLWEIHRAHLMVVPSVTAADGDQEGIPVAAMEAMATGLPVLATRHSGIPELLEDRVSGRLVAERDPAALATGIVEILANAIIYQAYAQAARLKVETDFNATLLNASLEARLLQLVG